MEKKEQWVEFNEFNYPLILKRKKENYPGECLLLNYGQEPPTDEFVIQKKMKYM